MKLLKTFLLLSFCQSVFAANNYGIIEGKIAWPGEQIPPMRICAEKIATKKIQCLSLTKDNYSSAHYHWKLPVGSYYIYAQVLRNEGQISPSYRAYYSEFVTCGQQASCHSHQPIPVAIKRQKKINDINPVDWYQ